MSAEDLDVPRDLLERVQDAVGQQGKLCVLKKVNLEVKGDKLENRILVSTMCFLFLLSTRVPAKLLVCICVCLFHMCVFVCFRRVIKNLSLKPVERITSLQTLWENHTPAEAGPCGGFSRLYWCVCDQMNVPYRDEVQWDVDTIYLSQDTRELCLQDFIHLDNRDLLAITAALEFNQWFIKLSIKDFKLSADLCDQILRVVSRSTKLEELTLDNTGLKSDFAQKFAAALSQNPNSVLHTISLANNCLEDKGAVVLSSALSKLTPGLKQLDLSKTSLSAKGVSVLAQCFGSTSLTHLNLSGNTLRGDDIPHLWSFLSQSNHLHTLDLSNSECSLDLSDVLCCRKGKEFPSSFKQFFSSALSLQNICLSGTKLPSEGLKALLLGLACNTNLRDVSLDISGCELRSAGSQILEGCIAEIPNITSLDISDNGLDSDLSTLLVWLGKNRSIKHLSIGRNFSNIKTKNLGQVLVSLVHMIQEEDSPLASLSLADSRLKADLSVVLNALGGNSSLTHLDISGNSMGDFGAKMLAKALQVNTKLRTVIWDRNCVSAQGLQDVAAALEKNYTIRFMPVPITDAAQALKNNSEKTEDALMKMEQYLLRNHESRRYLQEQAFRLQQGLVTSTTQQVTDHICRVQDQLNSLRFSMSDRVQQDMKATENLMRDAKNSTTLLRSLYHLRSSGRAAGGSDGSAGVCVQQVQEKLCSVAGEISALIDQQLQGLLVSMLDTAQSVCPHIMQQARLREDLLRASEGRTSVSKAFITSTLLEQSAFDIINKIRSATAALKFTLVLWVNTGIHKYQMNPFKSIFQKSIHSRMFRPMSVAFELGFDLCKALEDVCVEDLPPPPLSPTPPPPPPVTPPPLEAELQQPRPMSFSDLPTEDTPTLQHVTKYRPRRTKKAKPRRAAVSHANTATTESLRWGIFVKFGSGSRDSSTDARSVCRPRESRLSGFFCSIKHRASAEAMPTSPTATAEPEAPPPVPAVTSDPVAAPEVKGHAQEGIKHGSPHKRVQMLGNDMLAEIRAKQEKRKKVRLECPVNCIIRVLIIILRGFKFGDEKQ
uniref:CARMIL C-terminal domain-containing protein n=1 Tax=Sinocyclocheilus anshuiensis TaxID=1608454 RepID=A0A671Q2Z0_9TELE